MALTSLQSCLQPTNSLKTILIFLRLLKGLHQGKISSEMCDFSKAIALAFFSRNTTLTLN